MKYVLRKWFEVVTKEIRRLDPNHLISTPKLSIWDFKPQLELARNAGHFEAMRGLFDLLSVDWYSSKPEHSEKAMKDILNVS